MFQTNKCHIDIKLMPVKTAYFFLLGALAMLLPYLPVFMGVLKLTPTQMSIIIGIGTAVSAPIRLIIGYIADRLQKRNFVYATASFFAIIFYLSIYFTPSHEVFVMEKQSKNISGELCYISNDLIMKAFNETIVFSKGQNANESHLNMTEMTCCYMDDSEAQVKCLNFFHSENKDHQLSENGFTEAPLSHLNVDIDVPKNNSSCVHFAFCNLESGYHIKTDNNYKTFWIFLVLFFFAQITFSPLQNILDSLIYSFLSKTGKIEDFGKSRLWGTIGFGLCACISGVVQDVLSENGWKGREAYLISFLAFCLGLFLSATATLLIKLPASDDSDKHKKITMISMTNEDVPSEGNVTNRTSKRELLKIFCGFYLSIIIMTGMVAGILAGCLESFFFYFLISLDPNNKSVMGISLAIACVCEVVVLYFSGRILARVGYPRCLYIVFVVFAIRFIACSYIENPWYGLLTESTQCICFGLLYPIMSSWASSLVSPQFQSTVQCYLGAIYFSLGRAVGTALAGLIYDTLGPRIMFRIFAGIACTYVLVLVLVFELLDRMRPKHSKKVNEVNDFQVEVGKVKSTDINF